METAAKEILKIDKTNWTPVKFGDVVFEPKENAKDIYNEGIEHVVGLEHIDSENIHLTRSGNLEESTTFSKKFRKGDVLFGRRRAYLKKAALANFDGICSGDITVFRAKKNLMPRLLPFIVNNEKFFDYAIKHSAGGLSPRVKFKDLANYEFLLPPKDQQAQLAELLWAMDEVVEREKEVLGRLSTFKLSYSKDLFLGIKRLNNKKVNFKETSLGSIPADWTVKKVGEITKVIRGSSPRPKGDPRYYGGPVPRLMGEDVTRDGKYVTPKIDSLTEEGAKLSRPMTKGTLVMICSGNVGLTSFINVDCCVHDGFIAFPEISNECNPDFLYYTFNSQLHRLFQNATHGGVFTNLTTDIIKNFEIVIPQKEEQNYIGKEISDQDLRIELVKSKISCSQELLKSMINQVF
jgi:type I restriction enzyme, S subunit